MTRVDEEGKGGGGDMNTVWREREERLQSCLFVICCTAKQSDSDDRYCNTVTTRRTGVTGTRPPGASRQPVSPLPDNFSDNLPFLIS